VIELPKGAYHPNFRIRAEHRTKRKPLGTTPISVAVLPFLNLTPGDENEFWSDGLSDELTSVLASTASLRVISRTSSFAFKGKRVDVRLIGTTLGASLVVEGSVRMQHGRVRVAAQLTDARAGAQLWSVTLEREIEDAWKVQQEIATSIVAAIHLELTARDRTLITKRHTEVFEAFELCLKARHLIDRFEIGSQREALELFHRAHAADPAYPLPLMGTARAEMNLAVLGAAPPSEIVPRAKAALRQALLLDPEFAEAHALMASIESRHEWNWRGAEAHYQLALRLAPHAPEVHDEYATNYLTPLGRIEEALAENRIARELDPFSPQSRRSYVLILLLARRLANAELECGEVLKDRPQDGYVRLILALALHGQGRLQEALVEYQRIYEADPSDKNEVYVASVYALCGDRAPAEKLLKRLHTRAKSEFVPAMMFVWLHVHLEDLENAFAALEKAAENREYELLIANVAYAFDSFRAHPRFRFILEKLGLD
jgi:serine/threonine-protein kinase